MKHANNPLKGTKLNLGTDNAIKAIRAQYGVTKNEARFIQYIMNKAHGMLLVNLNVHDVTAELEIGNATYYRCLYKLIDLKLLAYSQNQSNYWIHPLLFNPNYKLL